MRYVAKCKCGALSAVVEDRKAAEVLADVHESKYPRRPYQHDAVVVEVERA